MTVSKAAIKNQEIFARPGSIAAIPIERISDVSNVQIVKLSKPKMNFDVYSFALETSVFNRLLKFPAISSS